MSDVHDPGPDPRFPDRPDHEDLHRLARIIQGMDNRVERGGREALLKEVSDIVDAESVGYVAEQRALRFFEQYRRVPIPTARYELMAWLWREAFLAGTRFARGEGET